METESIRMMALQIRWILIDTGEFRVCVNTLNNDESACTTGYNSEDKQPEHVFINLFSEENRNLPNGDVDSQAQSQSQDNEQHRAKAKIMSRLQQS